VTLNSPAQAKQHYEGKNHKRRIIMEHTKEMKGGRFGGRERRPRGSEEEKGDEDKEGKRKARLKERKCNCENKDECRCSTGPTTQQLETSPLDGKDSPDTSREGEFYDQADDLKY
jgi:hypothetical protein